MDVNRHADHTTYHVDKLDINGRAANNIFCFVVNYLTFFILISKLLHMSKDPMGK